MAMDKYKVPNWAQAQLAKAAGGWDQHDVAVSFEDDGQIIFLHYKEHVEYAVDKKTGTVFQR